MGDTEVSKSDSDEITKFEQLRWKKLVSQRVARFAELIEDDEVFQKHFGEPYVEELADKCRFLFRTAIKLALVYVALLLSLFTYYNVSQADIEVLGYAIRNIGEYKELILVIAVTLWPITGLMLAYHSYLQALAQECLKKLVPDEDVRVFYAHKFFDHALDWIGPGPKEEQAYAHWFTLIVLLLLLLGVGFLVICFSVGSFYIQVTVIYDVWTNPGENNLINVAVLVYSIAAILISWLIIMAQWPLPEVDFGNYAKLERLKEEDPDTHQEVFQRIAANLAKREAFGLLISYTLVFVMLNTAIVLFWFPEVISDLSVFIGQAIPGAMLVVFFGNEIVGFIRKRTLASFLSKYPAESDERMTAFRKVQKRLWWNRILVPAVLTITHAFIVNPGAAL